ncbi:ArsR/SmtB family transcription factor [Rhodovulum sp.]|uniref:ArsR/SmtB family transcription factor n=1 Tax=Rhodovulum sp. TaxID=34009 RepID=UPI0017B810C3|nr:transcriptional regulator [Rhodovulum sp.]HDR28991.1 transcriptional regulator [Rhodovulum sp.]
MTATSPHARALAALGHDARLSIFRLLVRAGNAGLVLQDRQGREVFNRVNYPAMQDLVGFLTSECCCGVTVPSAEDAA